MFAMYEIDFSKSWLRWKKPVKPGKKELFKLLSTAKQDEQCDAVKFAVIFILNRYLTSMIKISRMRKVIIL